MTLGGGGGHHHQHHHKHQHRLHLASSVLILLVILLSDIQFDQNVPPQATTSARRHVHCQTTRPDEPLAAAVAADGFGAPSLSPKQPQEIAGTLHPLGNPFELRFHCELAQLLSSRFQSLFSHEEVQLMGSICANHSAATTSGQLGGHDELGPHEADQLETRSQLGGQASGQQQQQQQPTNTTGGGHDDDQATATSGSNLYKRNYFRILNRVFSRVELPDVFKRSNQIRSSAAGQASSSGSGHCGLHIGCIDELPNFPSLLKLKPNVSASFTIYNRRNTNYSSSSRSGAQSVNWFGGVGGVGGGVGGGQRIMYEPIMHHQLEEPSKLSESELLDEALKFGQSLGVGGGGGGGSAGLGDPRNSGSSSAAALLLRPPGLGQKPATIINYRRGSNKNNNLRQQQVGPISSTLPGGGGGSRQQQQQQQQQAANKQITLNNWRSTAKIAHSLELPFDLSLMERSGFNAALTTRVIIGGYFAKEDEEWIDELVRQWLLLDDCNVIKVSWQDSNRGLYHTAAYNSRIVGRQLSLFLHYLNELFQVDLDKFHLVGHSLGAHIAGFVGADNEGQLARITGLDPAGPIFFELPPGMRLDPSDAKFVDVLHTNGGTITKGALGISLPSGHVDYYCNGGSLQPGCYFSSVGKSIMDPVERVACNHRRSYRYFTELIRLAIQLQAAWNQSAEGETPPAPGGANQLEGFPQAFLFHSSQKQEELTRLMQPELAIIASNNHNNNNNEWDQSPPLKWRLEFHLLRPQFPHRKRGLYYFRTRSEAPFFGSRQYAITLRSEQQIKRKLVLLAKINNSLVAECELDEFNGSYSILFAPQDPRLIDAGSLVAGTGRPPELWLMWRQRSTFNLLLGQQSELQLSSIELNLLEEEDSSARQPTEPSPTNRPAKQQVKVIRYLATAGATTATTATSSSSSSSSTLTRGTGGHQEGGGGGGSSQRSTSLSLPNVFALARNQWHKFEPKLD